MRSLNAIRFPVLTMLVAILATVLLWPVLPYVGEVPEAAFLWLPALFAWFLYLGPVLSYSYQGGTIGNTNLGWWMTLTPTLQLTDVQEAADFQIRLMAGILALESTLTVSPPGV